MHRRAYRVGLKEEDSRNPGKTNYDLFLCKLFYVLEYTYKLSVKFIQK